MCDVVLLISALESFNSSTRETGVCWCHPDFDKRSPAAALQEQIKVVILKLLHQSSLEVAVYTKIQLRRSDAYETVLVQVMAGQS